MQCMLNKIHVHKTRHNYIFSVIIVIFLCRPYVFNEKNQGKPIDGVAFQGVASLKERISPEFHISYT